MFFGSEKLLRVTLSVVRCGQGRLAVPASAEVAGRGFSAFWTDDLGARELFCFFEVLFDEVVGAAVVFGVDNAKGGEEIRDGGFGDGKIFVFDESGDSRSFEQGLVKGHLDEIAFAEEFFHGGASLLSRRFASLAEEARAR